MKIGVTRLVLMAALLMAAVPAMAPVASQAQQSATCVTSTVTEAGGRAKLSGVNGCGIEVHFNLCALSAAAPTPQRFAKTLKPNEAWSYEMAATPGVKPMIASDYCRAGPGTNSGTCAATCPSVAALTTPTWVRRPTAEDFARYYPERASRAEISGRAVLACTFDATGGLTACSVAEETPAGQGFGEAALRMSRLFRSAPTGADGKPVAGTTVRLPITFRLG